MDNIAHFKKNFFKEFSNVCIIYKSIIETVRDAFQETDANMKYYIPAKKGLPGTQIV